MYRSVSCLKATTVHHMLEKADYCCVWSLASYHCRLLCVSKHGTELK